MLALQRRNPGRLLPELQQRVLERAEAERQAEEEARAAQQPIRVQDRHDPATYDAVARRAIQSRQRNRHTAADPHLAILRGQPGPSRYPSDDYANECFTAPWAR